MAINEQTKKAKILFVSTSQSDEISAKPDTSPITFHEALNPTITSRTVGKWVMENLGKKWWIVYADYAFGKQNTAVFSALVPKLGGTILGSTPYPLGKPEFSAHLPKIQAAKPDAIYAITPGADSVPFMKQAISFGLKKDAKIAQPLHFLDYAKEAGAETFQDVYGATHFCHELAETIPQAKRYVEAFTKKFNRPPDAYSGYGYSGILEVTRGVELAKSTDSDAVANALRKNREYDHYKGKQWWRACDNKSFQDLWILKVRSPQQVKGEWGFFDVVGKVAANEELDRTCAEKGHA
jgi:branched-chain amino acid transport system substrate-binding protein